MASLSPWIRVTTCPSYQTPFVDGRPVQTAPTITGRMEVCLQHRPRSAPHVAQVALVLGCCVFAGYCGELHECHSKRRRVFYGMLQEQTQRTRSRPRRLTRVSIPSDPVLQLSTVFVNHHRSSGTLNAFLPANSIPEVLRSPSMAHTGIKMAISRWMRHTSRPWTRWAETHRLYCHAQEFLGEQV